MAIASEHLLKRFPQTEMCACKLSNESLELPSICNCTTSPQPAMLLVSCVAFAFNIRDQMRTTQMQTAITAISGIFSDPSTTTAFPASNCKAGAGEALKALSLTVHLDHTGG